MAEGKSDILGKINAPLVFYALALLIVEVSTGVAVTGLPESKKWWGFVLMFAAFVLVVGIVTFLVIRAPKDLVFGKEEHAAHTAPSALRDQIEDLIHENVKPDCLKKP